MKPQVQMKWKSKLTWACEDELKYNDISISCRGWSSVCQKAAQSETGGSPEWGWAGEGYEEWHRPDTALCGIGGGMRGG